MYQTISNIKFITVLYFYALRYLCSNIIKSNHKMAEQDLTSELYKTIPTEWGFYKSVHYRPYDHSKSESLTRLLSIDPLKQIAQTKHSKRDLHIIVLKGKVCICQKNQKRTFSEGSHVYIQRATPFLIENLSTEPLFIMETQLGEKLGVDDSQ